MQPPMQYPPSYAPVGPAATPPHPRTGLAVAAALASCFGMPVVYFVSLIIDVADRRGNGFVAFTAAAIVGFALWVTALVLSIRAIVVSGRIGASRSGGVVALVFSLISMATAAVSIFFSFFIAAGGGAHGRPLRVRGRPRTAPTRRDDAWVDAPDAALPDASRLSADERAREAARWTRDAREEHASVAAFSRLSLDLLALGAGASLVERAHRAALDEVRHARLGFALASAYAGAPVGPDGWPDALVGPGVESARDTLRRVAVESLVDGAYGEGLAALRAEAERSDDPAVAAVLAVIARDEAVHAALGWDVMVFCVGRDPSLAAELTEAAEGLRARADSSLERAHAEVVATDLRARLVASAPVTPASAAAAPAPRGAPPPGSPSPRSPAGRAGAWPPPPQR